MFIRKKGQYWQLVESRRVGAKVSQRVIASLGKGGDLHETLDSLQRQLATQKRWLNNLAPAKNHIPFSWAAKLNDYVRTLQEQDRKQGKPVKSGKCIYGTTEREYWEARVLEHLSARREAKADHYRRCIASLESRIQRIARVIGQDVVPDLSVRPERLVDLGTTEHSLPVVPEMSRRRDNLGTTQVGVVL